MKPAFLNQKNKAKTQPHPKPPSKTQPNFKANRTHRKLRATTSSPPSPPSKPSLLASITKFTCILATLLLISGTILYLNRDKWGITDLIQGTLHTDNSPKPNPEKYNQLIAKLNKDRTLLKERFLNARTTSEQDKIINQASTLIEERLPPMMHCWLGHPWDFNGTATIPGQGKIACGYFVSVIMRDAGFNIDRIRVAQQPSQNIILTFVRDKKFYEIKTQTPYHQYINHICAKPEGIHIIGLDTHVAFVVIKNGEMRYIHSGGRQKCVVDEDKANAGSLESSNYRVISNISRNKNVIRKWLLGHNFPTVFNRTSL